MADRYAPLAEVFGARLLRDEPLSRYTAARLGGPADALLVAYSSEDLIVAASLAWKKAIPALILGGGANLLVADAGWRGLVIVNRARGARIDPVSGRVTAESGTSLSTLARQCISRGLGGLEWSVSVPGTVGGAVVNNAGAHDGDMAGCVESVELVFEEAGSVAWGLTELAYGYRSSALKGSPRRFVVCRAALRLRPGQPVEALTERAEAFVAHRKQTQPPGASLGSVFKNPPGDYAGHLIEAAGLKGHRSGGAQISALHANFFVNVGEARAADYFALIELAQGRVWERFGVRLELEIELVRETGLSSAWRGNS